MNSLPDSAGEARRTWLCEQQDSLLPLQSDFEKTPIFRASMVIAAIVVGLSIFGPQPSTVTSHVAVRPSV
jgi:hypothetical protein